MSLPVFNGGGAYAFPSGDSFSTHFTVTQGSASQGSNLLQGTSAAENSGYWASDAFGADHYSQAKLVNFGGGAGTPGVTCRHQGTGGTTAFYLATPHSSTTSVIDVYKLKSGTTYTLLGSTSGTAAAGDTIKLSAVGSGTVALTVSINGTPQTAINDDGSVGGAVLTGGAAGVYIYSTSAQLDDFTADTISSGTANNINAASGSYSVGGVDATLQQQLNFNAAAGSYSVTGFAATLVSSTGTLTTLSLDPGSYTVSGVDFGNQFIYNINTTIIPYAETGFFIPTPAISYNLSIDPGSFAVTGANTGPAVFTMATDVGIYGFAPMAINGTNGGYSAWQGVAVLHSHSASIM